MKSNFLFIILILGFVESSGQRLSGNALYHSLNEQLTEVIVTDGFSPPAASRIYAYANIAGYEMLAKRNAEYQSLGGQLSGFEEIAIEVTSGIDSEYLLVWVYTEVGKELVYRVHLLDHFRQAYLRDRSDMTVEVRAETENFGALWKMEYMKWISEDGYLEVKEGMRYTPFLGDSCWEPTPPAYLDALEPNWYKLRPLVLDSVSEILTSTPVVFDTVEGSQFYIEAMEVYDAVNNLKDEEKETALFWDCNPLQTQVMGHFNFASRQLSPGGHWLNIVKISTSSPEYSIMRVAEIYAVTSVGMYDGFLLAWYEKYRSSLVRPETYINQYIDSEWRTILETPPFPEHPSAHSVISSAASIILTELIGDNFAFEDNSEEPFGLAVRNFSSFNEASNEAAYSRLPGGIHYRTGIVAGVATGKKMGTLVMKRIKTKK
jgi:hypothetical protein